MLQAEASTTVTAGPREVLEFVLDLQRYRQADPKIGRVSRPVELDADGVGTTRYWGHLRGLPPAPDENIVRLTEWSDLTFTSARRQPARLIVDFEGRFHCEETPAGCVVTHGYTISFHRPLRWIYEPLLGNWLQREIVEEMERLGELLGPA